MSLARRSLAEFAGTGLLMIVVVAAGLLADWLGGVRSPLALAAAGSLIGVFAFVLSRALMASSGAHLNPAVSLFAYVRGTLQTQELVAYAAAQVGGALLGVLAAHAIFGLPLLQASHRLAMTLDQRFGEVLATTGLLVLVAVVPRWRLAALPALLAIYLAAAYALSATLSLGNPALSLARAATATYAGISLTSVPGLLIAQFGAIAIAFGVLLLLPPDRRSPSATPPA